MTATHSRFAVKRCSWCNRIIWPWAAQSSGGSMHRYCGEYVDRITTEDQDRYEPAAATPYSYEDFLSRLEDEDGGW